MANVEMVEVKTEGTKELHELGLALKSIMVATQQALKDGWQPGTDIPAIVASSFVALPTAIDGLNKAKDEVKGRPVPAITGVVVPVLEGVDALLELKDDKKEDAETSSGVVESPTEDREADEAPTQE